MGPTIMGLRDASASKKTPVTSTHVASCLCAVKKTRQVWIIGYGSNLLFSFSECTCTWTKTVHHLGFARSGEIEEWLNLKLYDLDGSMLCGLQDLLLIRCFKEYVSRYELTFATFLSSADPRVCVSED